MTTTVGNRIDNADALLPGLSRENWANLEPLPLRTGVYDSQALGRIQPYSWLGGESVERQALSGESKAVSLNTQHSTLDARRFPLLVLLHGYDGHYTDWPTYTRVARYAAAYNLIVAFPEGGNGWYTNGANDGERWEDDFIQDFIPHLQVTLPLALPGPSWAIGGLSMGGYGAIKLALKHPHLFSVGFSHSGAFHRITRQEPHPVFGDPHQDAKFRRQENPAYLVEQALCRWPTERPRLHFDCGLNDPLLADNRKFADHCAFLGYPYTYAEAPGHHTWPYWDRALRSVLPTIAHEIGATPRIVER